MTWAVVHHSRILYQGTREDCLAQAERYGLVCHLSPETRDLVGGRGFYPDQTEIPPRLTQGAVLIPAHMLPERYRRRAA